MPFSHDRRIPIKPEQRKMVVSAFKAAGQVMTVEHNAMPFGTIGAVHAWHRVGQMMWHIITTMSMIPHQRYVDDYFGVVRQSLVENTAKCVKEVIEVLMGTGVY